jgi:hypothetical protein
MPRTRKGPTETLNVQISARLKKEFKDIVDDGLQVNAVETAIERYVQREKDGADDDIHFKIEEPLRRRLAAYCREDGRHRPPQENVAYDALKLLLRVGNESQSEEFVVRLRDRSLIDRFADYRERHEWDRSRVAERALDFFLTVKMSKSRRGQG